MKKTIVIILCCMLMISLGLNTFIMMYTSNKQSTTEEKVDQEVKKQPTEFEKRVAKYKKEHSDMDEQEAEKRVRMDLDKEPYQDAKKAENLDSSTVLVNKYNYLDENYVPTNLAFMYSDTMNGKDVYLADVAKEAYLELCNYCAMNGIEMSLVSGYESYKDLEDAYNLNNALIKAGFDDKQTGYTCDVTFDTYLPLEDIVQNSFYPQFLEHLHEYGFILRYPNDKKDYTLVDGRAYTIRYVGVDAATNMYTNNLSLEEYVCLNN